VLDHSDYRSIEERLAEWRTEILTRMDRGDELAALPTFTRVNLAREYGTGARVDSFLGTANPQGPDDAYPQVLDAAAGRITQGALPFAVEDPQHPVLVELRRRFPLQEVAGDGPDVDRAVRLRDWIKSLFPHRIPFRMPEWNALLVLDRGSRGVEHFICVHYSVSLVQCALAVGMQARVVNLHRGISDSYRIGDEAKADPPVDEHVVAEVWSSELGRWVMMDTDFDCHYERDGVPLSAWDVHRAFVDGELDAITCRRGPHSASFNAYGEGLPDDDAFFARELPSYYAHISLLMRNDFLSDPDGPVPVAHPLDEKTGPILWHRGSDNRLQPHLMGPVVVAQPWTDRTPVLTDGNLRTGWASADTLDEHVAEVGLTEPHLVGRVVLHWPEYRLRYQTSAAYRLDGRDGDGRWSTVAKVSELSEAPYTVHDIAPTQLVAVRVVQEPGGGSENFPNRLWLNQIEVYAPAAE
jgi:hypothetical protein